MISRKTARVIAEVYQREFSTSKSKYYSGSRTQGTETRVFRDKLYDFLFDHDYPAWLLNQAKELSYTSSRSVQEWIMKLHTGETTYSATPNWDWEQRRQLGQNYLEELAEDMIGRLLVRKGQYEEERRLERLNELTRSVELDGYRYRDGVLLRPESDVLDVKEERGVLQNLFKNLGLDNAETAFHHLALSEEHYLAGRWDDSISNSRKFFESTMQESAALHAQTTSGESLKQSVYTRPVAVREYLEREGLLETKEKEAISKVYGLLSETGGHPYMAQDDQARLLRHLALTLSQFVLLRLQGSLHREPDSA